MKSRVVFFFIAFIVWCLLNWFPDIQHITTGILVAMLVTWLTGDIFIKRPYVFKDISRYWNFFFLYVPVFLWEMIKANFDVAFRVIHPKLPINPGIVKVSTTLKNDVALTFLANSITLTPGTLVVDIDRDDNVLYVHWIDVKAKDAETATKRIVRLFEGILKKVFD
jgi:multicomponent Na+:H+ antiporter subunit E